jgi:hypothetical protein
LISGPERHESATTQVPSNCNSRVQKVRFRVNKTADKAVINGKSVFLKSKTGGKALAIEEGGEWYGDR